MDSTTGHCGGTPAHGTTKGTRQLTSGALDALLAKSLCDAVEAELRARALRRDASGMRPGDVLLAQMREWDERA